MYKTTTVLHIKDSMCLPHIRVQLFTLTPIFFYYITHVHLLQFSPYSIPDILCPPELREVLRYTYF